MSESHLICPPYNYLRDAKIYNKKDEIVPWHWIEENADILVLLFTAKGIDKDGIIENFYKIYENVKHRNFPLEVIYVPTDETEDDMKACYEEQANWFTLKLSDSLVPALMYIYEITCIPHVLVIDVNGSVISKHGLIDLVEYGKNAVVSWLSTSGPTKNHRRVSKDAAMYGTEWRFHNAFKPHAQYKKKFSDLAEATSKET